MPNHRSHKSRREPLSPRIQLRRSAESTPPTSRPALPADPLIRHSDVSHLMKGYLKYAALQDVPRW